MCNITHFWYYIIVLGSRFAHQIYHCTPHGTMHDKLTVNTLDSRWLVLVANYISSSNLKVGRINRSFRWHRNQVFRSNNSKQLFRLTVSNQDLSMFTQDSTSMTGNFSFSVAIGAVLFVTTRCPNWQKLWIFRWFKCNFCTSKKKTIEIYLT